MYRVESKLRSGEVIPLRSFYSVGRRRKERLAEKLRAVVNAGGEVWISGIALWRQNQR